MPADHRRLPGAVLVVRRRVLAVGGERPLAPAVRGRVRLRKDGTARLRIGHGERHRRRTERVSNEGNAGRVLVDVLALALRVHAVRVGAVAHRVFAMLARLERVDVDRGRDDEPLAVAEVNRGVDGPLHALHDELPVRADGLRAHAVEGAKGVGVAVVVGGDGRRMDDAEDRIGTAGRGHD